MSSSQDDVDVLRRPPRVLIVGAGAAGLVALKEHLEAGNDAYCVEKTQEIGGVFSTRKDSSYDGLYLTTSNVYMSFSDFPWPNDKIRYSPKEDYAEYLNLYADHFGLRSRIRFGVEVESVQRLETGWRVDGEYYDSLVIATGANSEPKGLEDVAVGFEGGTKIHSKDFQNAEPYRGKTVLVVGTGESASDIAADLVGIASKVYVWARRPFVIAPRFPEMIMNDPEHDEYDIMKTDKDVEMSHFLEFFNTSRFLNTAPVWYYGLLRQQFWRAMASSRLCAAGFKTCAVWSRQVCRMSDSPWKAFWMADQPCFATKNSRLATLVGKGHATLWVSESAKFDKQSVAFDDVILEDTTELDHERREIPHVDAVIGCVGYKPKTIVDDLVPTNPRLWYKHCFPPGYADGSLAMIGWARGHQGGIPQLAELLARYHALVVSGKRDLPENYEELAKYEGDAETDYYFVSPNLSVLVDYPSFADSIADLIGCRPTPPWTKPALFFKYWHYPLWSCWYRLKGPGANPKAAMTVLDRFPISTMGPMAIPPLIFSSVGFCFQTIINAFSCLFRRHAYNRNFFWDRSKIIVLHNNKPRIFS